MPFISYAQSNHFFLCTNVWSYRKGFYGSKVVWILMAGGYGKNWWTYKDVNCTEKEVREALGNHLSTEALMIGTNKQQTVAGKVCANSWV